MGALNLESVSKQFADVVAADNVSLSCPDGDFLVLLGSSGSGKTTLLRLIAGLERATSGDIRISGRRVNDVPPKDRNIAMVFQNYALYPHMRVRANMSLGLKHAHLPKAEIRQRVDTAGQLLGISELMRRYPRQLSGGQQQRVALGRAIVREPEIFLMDEPLSNLDARLRVETRGELIRLHRRLGTTIVYVTHDQTEAMTMGTRIAVLRQGVLQQVGEPWEIFDRPINKYVAGFMGETRMNFIDGEISLDSGHPRLTGAGIALEVPESFARLRGVTGSRAVTLGVRPEHFELADADNGSDIDGRVELYERLGSRALIFVTTAGGSLVVEASAHREIGIGARVGLKVDWNRRHLFDLTSGSSLLPPAL